MTVKLTNQKIFHQSKMPTCNLNGDKMVEAVTALCHVFVDSRESIRGVSQGSPSRELIEFGKSLGYF